MTRLPVSELVRIGVSAALAERLCAAVAAGPVSNRHPANASKEE